MLSNWWHLAEHNAGALYLSVLLAIVLAAVTLMILTLVVGCTWVFIRGMVTEIKKRD